MAKNGKKSNGYGEAGMRIPGGGNTPTNINARMRQGPGFTQSGGHKSVNARMKQGDNTSVGTCNQPIQKRMRQS